MLKGGKTCKVFQLVKFAAGLFLGNEEENVEINRSDIVSDRTGLSHSSLTSYMITSVVYFIYFVSPLRKIVITTSADVVFRILRIFFLFLKKTYL